MIAGLALVALLVGGSAAPGAPGLPSAHCHVVDGSFTSCPDGSSEWSDVPAAFFEQTNAYLYADQADLDPALKSPRSDADTFELMYDECDVTSPLGPDEYFLVSFDTIEDEDGESEFEKYAVHVFSDGTIIFFENGKPVPDGSGHFRVHEIEGQRGDAAFGPSPHCPADHLTVEFEIKLTATGLELNGGYSPDPIFWGATPPKRPPIANDDEGNLEDNDSVTVPVVANDTDSDGTIDPMTVVVAAQPAHGTATANGDGTITFVKDEDFKHDDEFTYTVNDDDGLTSNAGKVEIVRPCSRDVGASIDDKSSPAAAGKLTKKGTDVDKDGIKHEDEKRAGTDPCHYDTDGDGLPDPWEVPSSIAGAGIDLNGDGSPEASRDQVFGATDAPRPLHKDVYVEMDFYDCAQGNCMLGDPMVHDLTPEAVAAERAMFASLPVQNPDKTSGIALHLQADEHIRHEPNCLQPPFVNPPPNFGTIDQRANPNVVQAKRLAYRYLISGHSTLFPSTRSCPTPYFAIAGQMFGLLALEDYDNTPFGRASLGGADIVLSLGPVWICPRDKVVAAPLVIPTPVPIFVLATITVCDRESIFDPGIFPAKIPRGGTTTVLNQPYSRALGRQNPADPFGSERRGIAQIQSRAIAHLLGNALGLGDGAVGNDPALSTAPPGDFWPPDPYSGVGGITYADSLHSTSDGGDHLSFTRLGGGSGHAELDVFGNPIIEFLQTDRDGDGRNEGVDNCPGFANPGQEDLDGDGVGDACDRDIDGDAEYNAVGDHPAAGPPDAHLLDTDDDGTPNADDTDDDGDLVPDSIDDCTLVANPGQSDVDGDGIGDACDGDADGDAVDDALELNLGSKRLVAASKPEFAGFGSTCSDGRDNDEDGLVDGADPTCVDGDGDGLPDPFDNCPTLENVGWGDLNGNGQGDACDAEADGDGFGNVAELAFGSDPFEADSTPEAREVDETCSDGEDNDRDGWRDDADLRCQAGVAGLHAIRPGFDGNAVPANDDGSVGPVALGFTPNFFGRTYDTAFVNNNGNLTFDEALSVYTPFDLKTTARAIVAPFFADVDTRAGNVARYGTGTVDAHRAFGVTWPGVGCYSRITSVLDFFQVVLVDRSDVGTGDFDIEFDYDQIQWEAGIFSGGDGSCQGGDAARVGFAKGTAEPGTSFELPGSGVPGSFLDSNLVTGLVHTSRGSAVPGRFVFPVRNGTPQPVAGRDGDGVPDDLDNCPFTPNAGQADTDGDGIGDACASPRLLHTTAGFLQAGLDGTTSVDPASLLLGDEPSLSERLVLIVRFRLDAGLADDAHELTEELVHSLVESGLVPMGGGDALVADVLAHLDETPPVVKVTFPAPGGQNGWFVSSPVTGTLTANDVSKVAAVTCTGATVGAVTGLGTPSASAALTVTGDGVYEVSCSATDGVGNAGAGPDSVATATVKIDATPPAVTCSGNPPTLWPANHKLVDVTTAVAVDGGASGAAGAVLTKAASSEPDDGLGEGDTANDIQGWEVGTPDTTGELRAERSGTGPGRDYTLTYTGADVAGNTSACAVAVKVPHDQSK